MGELEEIIKNLKRKPPGPDNITHEAIKDMSSANKDFLLDLLNKWLMDYNISIKQDIVIEILN